MKYLVSILLLLFSTMGWAQCAETSSLKNELKATIASAYSEVTKDQEGIIYLDNSRFITGREYIATDNYGSVFTGELDASLGIVIIKVGQMDAPRSFTIKVKATNENCEYQLPNEIRISPVEDPVLSLRSRAEFCRNGGGVYFEMTGPGVNKDDYTYEYKSPTTSVYVPVSNFDDLQAVRAGEYHIRAILKADTSKVYNGSILVDNKYKQIQYTAIATPVITCATTTSGKLRIDVTEATSYPCRYEILSGPQTRPLQDSPIFENLPTGNYKLRVYDGCGEAFVRDFYIGNNTFNFNTSVDFRASIPRKADCELDKMLFYSTQYLSGIDLRDHDFPFPLTVNYKITSPSGKEYPSNYTFNSLEEWVNNLSPNYDVPTQPGQYIDRRYSRNWVRWKTPDDIPVEVGAWKFDITLEACGKTWTANQASYEVKRNKTIFDTAYLHEVRYDACGNDGLSIKTTENFSEHLNGYNGADGQQHNRIHVMLLEWPAEYTPASDGWYKKPALYGDVFVKENIDLHIWGNWVITGPNFKEGSYKVKIVNRCKEEKEITVTTDGNRSVSSDHWYALHMNPTCEDSTKADMYVYLPSSTGDTRATTFKITNFVPTPGSTDTLPSWLRIPYEVDPFNSSNHEFLSDRAFRIKGLPGGTYSIEIGGFKCGNDIKRDITFVAVKNIEPKITFFKEGCDTKINFKFENRASLTNVSEVGYNSSFMVQVFDENGINITERDGYNYGGVHIVDKHTIYNYGVNGYTWTISGNWQQYKKFRVIEVYNNSTFYNLLRERQCIKFHGEAFEKESQRPVAAEVIGKLCSGTQYELVVIGREGYKPYKFRIIQRNGQSFSGEQNNTGVFKINETAASAVYRFEVEDACGNKGTIDKELVNIQVPPITPDRTDYCLNTNAKLSIFNSDAFTYKWYREDDPSRVLGTGAELIIPSLTNDDFVHKYKLEIGVKVVTDNVCFTGTYEYKFVPSTKSNTTTLPKPTNMKLCTEGLTDVQRREYDIRANLFAGFPAEGKITNKDGYAVPQSAKINLDYWIRYANPMTFIYTYTTECGTILTEEASITIENPLPVSYGDQRYCETDLPTLRKLEDRIRTQNGFIDAGGNTFEFEWFKAVWNAPANKWDYTKTTDYTNNVFEGVVSTVDNTRISFRVKKSSSACWTKQFDFTVYRSFAHENNSANVDRTITLCEGATINELINELRKTFNVNYNIYVVSGGKEELISNPSNYQVSLTDKYIYRVNPGTDCLGSPRNITVKFLSVNITQQPPSDVTVCKGAKGATHEVSVKATTSTSNPIRYEWVLLNVDGSGNPIPYSVKQWMHYGNSDHTSIDYTKYKIPIDNEGKYYYQVRVYDTGVSHASCMLWSDIITVDVQTTPLAPTLTYTGTAVVLCSEETSEVVSFADYVTPLPGHTLAWYGFANGGTESRTTPTIDKKQNADFTRTYYVAQKTSAGCDSPRTAVTITIKKVDAPKVNVVNRSCTAEGSAVIENYNAAYTYTFSDSALSQTDGTISGFKAGVTYTLTQDNGICSRTTTFTIGSDCTIVANDDDMSTTKVVSQAGTTNLVNVLTNDELNGVRPIDKANVTITVEQPATFVFGATNRNVPVLDVNTGIVSVPENTPAGSYTIKYKICTANNTCDDAIVTIVVENTPIVAKADTMSVSSSVTQTVAGNVLTNNNNGVDTLNGTGADISKVTISVEEEATGTVKPVLDPKTGNVTVPAGTPAGNYTIKYKICEKLNPTNCSEIVPVTVSVAATPILAKDDTITIANGADGGTGRVLVDNGNGADLFNGVATNIGQVSVAVVTPATGGAKKPELDDTGVVTVPAGTPSGIYTIVYKICERANAGNCSQATATIKVNSAVINAKDDTLTHEDNEVEKVVGNVLNSNGDGEDTLNATPTNISQVTIRVVTPATGTKVPTLDPSNGFITSPAGTPPGDYSIVYSICDKLNANSCSQATATIRVKSKVSQNINVEASVPGVCSGESANFLISGGKSGETVVYQINTSPEQRATLDAEGKATITLPSVTVAQTITLKSVSNGVETNTLTGKTATINLKPVSTEQIPANTTETLPSRSIRVSVFKAIIVAKYNVEQAKVYTPAGVEMADTEMITAGQNYSVSLVEAGKCEGNKVSVAVRGANNTINAGNDTAVTKINEAVVIDVKNNDTDPDGDTIGVPTIETNPTNGTVTINNATGEITYTPNNNFTGNDTFTYKVCDNGNPSACDIAEVSVEVRNATNITTPKDDIAKVKMNNSVDIDVKANDTDPEGDTIISLRIVTQPIKGRAIYDVATGKVTYIPNANFTGKDTFTYEVCDSGNPKACENATVEVTVENENNKILPDDDKASTQINRAVEIDVRDGDTDPEGDTIGIPTIVVQPKNGTAVVDPTSGKVTYTPNNNFTGTDTFTYQVCDNGTPQACETASVEVSVTNPRNTTTPKNDTASTEMNKAVEIDVKVNDTDPEGDTIGIPTIKVQPNNGKVSVDATSGKIMYTPNNNFTGNDTFTYEVCDNGNPQACAPAVVQVTVQNATNSITPQSDTASTQMNKAVEIDVKVNDTDPEGDTIGIPTIKVQPNNGKVSVDATSGKVTYTPNNNFTGTDTFTYEVCDNATPRKCANADVTINVTNTGNTTVASDDTASTQMNKPVVINVKVNDTDPEGDIIEVQDVLKVKPTNGTATVNKATGEVTYTPNNGFTGVDTFEYEIKDKGNPVATDFAKVTITVSNPANTTAATDDAVTTPKNTAVEIDVKANDIDPEGDDQKAPTVVANPTNGRVIIDTTTGKVTYIPNADYVGTDSFEYEICDKATPSKCATAVVEVQITDTAVVINTTKAIDDVASTYKNTPKQIFVKANDFDAEGNRQGNPEVYTAPNNGTAVVNPDGSIIYTPNTDFVGQDTFIYKICDDAPSVACDFAKVTITIVTPSSERSLDLTKQAVSVIENPKVGQRVTYIFTVTNRGTEKLTNVVITDAIIGITLNVGELEVGNAYNTSVDYQIIQADIDNYRILNSAIVTGTKPDGSVEIQVSDNATPSTDEDGDGDKLNDPTITVFRVINANDDAGKVALDGSNDGKVPNLNIFDNDRINGKPITGNDVILTSTPINGISINPDGTISISEEVASGTYHLTYTICDRALSMVCDTAEVTIEVLNNCELQIYNAMSVNGDGSNDVLQIKNIECYPDNIVRIFNRWGVEVFNTEKYDNASRVFEGISTGRVTISKNLKLPQGTYYLILEYKLRNGESRRKGTWIYISPNDK